MSFLHKKTAVSDLDKYKDFFCFAWNNIVQTHHPHDHNNWAYYGSQLLKNAAQRNTLFSSSVTFVITFEKPDDLCKRIHSQHSNVITKKITNKTPNARAAQIFLKDKILFSVLSSKLDFLSIRWQFNVWHFKPIQFCTCFFTATMYDTWPTNGSDYWPCFNNLRNYSQYTENKLLFVISKILRCIFKPV